MQTDKIHPPCAALVDWRAAHGYSQADAARIIGVTKNQIAKWEAGRTRPRYRALITLMAKTGLDMEQFIETSVNPKPMGLRSDAEAHHAHSSGKASGSDKLPESCRRCGYALKEAAADMGIDPSQLSRQMQNGHLTAERLDKLRADVKAELFRMAAEEYGTAGQSPKAYGLRLVSEAQDILHQVRQLIDAEVA